MEFQNVFSLNLNSKTDDERVIVKDDIRVSVLTPYLLRIEKGKASFTDKPTQIVWHRNFQSPEFSKEQDGNKLTIKTEKCTFVIDTSNGKLKSVNLDGFGKCTETKNLRGTTRTLDGTFGPVPLKKGVLARGGLAVIDDSRSLLLENDGRIVPRQEFGSDKYYFAYGDNYRLAIKDFFGLTGNIPMLPRFCLGNWWSRYWAYTQQEYMDLMNRFEEENIPLTVATVDMDWHWVDVEKKFGQNASIKKQKSEFKGYDAQISGWTGYSWNTDLFPDYRQFLKDLKSKDLKVTLNLHPATGVQFFEDQYEDMAKAMGIDPETKRKVDFDIADPKFVENYFKYLHHGYESDGVDFWWIDWQQGSKSKIPGLDPLWALNHYHYMDNCRNGKRGLILSRYAEIGSHRYPLGFSGDTAVQWSVLKFQPYFTANASNAGYSWWSHDIGGHHMGYKDEELYLRWLQLGVFSPINRLHSTANPFMGKEPWRFSKGTEEVAKQWLRFRKRLIPYLYSANYATHFEGKVLVEPMYYSHPKDPEAYKVKNQFMFGEHLMVAPITKRTNRRTLMSSVKVWLDGEKYTDIFNGNVYQTKGFVDMYRCNDKIPVLAKAGSVIPLDMNETENGSENPKDMELLIFNGCGEFKLYEDDGETMNFESGAFASRIFSVRESKGKIEFSIPAYEGDVSVVQPSVHYRLSFRNIAFANENAIKITSGVKAEISNGEFLVIDLYDIKPLDEITVEINGFTEKNSRPKEEQFMDIVSRYQCSNIIKGYQYDYLNAKAKAVEPCFKKPLRELEFLKY